MRIFVLMHKLSRDKRIEIISLLVECMTYAP